jgi:multisubunit Na+/H+ antiporter MnhF subunit
VNTVTTIAIAMLTVAAIVNFARALRPGTIVDRAIALDSVVSALISGLGIAAVRLRSGELIDIALVGGLLGFLTLATVARYVGRRGA